MPNTHFLTRVLLLALTLSFASPVMAVDNAVESRSDGNAAAEEAPPPETPEQTLARLQEESAATAQKLQDVSERYEALAKQSATVVSIVAERDKFRDMFEKTKAEKDFLMQENVRVNRSGSVGWFMAGGAVFFAGWLAGRVSAGRRRFYR
jgi:hypothetical protein